MEHVVVALVALIASGVTFFSGFGLGTVLLPVFAVFLPTPAAVAATAVVHLLNSGLKTGLLRQHVSRDVVLVFGIPAFAAAPLGALALDALSGVEPIATYAVAGSRFAIHPLNVCIGALLLLLGVNEAVARRADASGSKAMIPVGGVVSGFIGGLAGLQGALRSAFLIRTGLDPVRFIATGAAIALLVDMSRLGIYAARGMLTPSGQDGSLLIAAVVGAAAGTLLATRFLPKVTMRAVRAVVAALLTLAAFALALGLI